MQTVQPQIVYKESLIVLWDEISSSFKIMIFKNYRKLHVASILIKLALIQNDVI